jgi:hypothetical protein
MRVSRTTALLLLGITSLSRSNSLIGQGAAGARSSGGVILGTVTDSGLRPVTDADISIVLSHVHVASDARGRFQIVDVPGGDYLLTVRRLGFRPIAAGVSVQMGDTVRPAFILEPTVAELPAVIVSERSASMRFREFEERRKSGMGEFFDQRGIEARNAVSTVDILRQAKGLRVVIDGTKTLAMSARQWTSCPMQVYVDGIPLAGAGSNQPFDLNLLPSPKEVMAVEVYSGSATVPQWLPMGPQSAKSGCGAILVWTRDGSVNQL